MLAAGLVLIGAAPASAHHPHGSRSRRSRAGSDNPRHVGVTKHGDVYVAESGRGGDGATSKSCFDSAEGFACTGATGAISRIDRWQRKQRVVSGLASFAPVTGNSAIGPHGIYADGHDVYFTNGGPTQPTREGETVLRDPTLVGEDEVSEKYGKLFKIRDHGRLREIADFWRFEYENNPDAAANPEVDSNPVDVYADDGRFYVADAGGNSVLRVGRFGGIRPLAVFGNVPNPTPIGPHGIQTVPTGVVKGPDGALYMSQLTGFPFLPDTASVYRIDPRGGPPTVYASGFTNAIDWTSGVTARSTSSRSTPTGLFPVTGGPSNEGALYAVPRRGGEPRQIELPAGTLTHPGGVAVGRRATCMSPTAPTRRAWARC